MLSSFGTWPHLCLSWHCVQERYKILWWEVVHLSWGPCSDDSSPASVDLVSSEPIHWPQAELVYLCTYWKKSTYKWTYAVQTCVVQESAVLGFQRNGISRRQIRREGDTNFLLIMMNSHMFMETEKSHNLPKLETQENQWSNSVWVQKLENQRRQ